MDDLSFSQNTSPTYTKKSSRFPKLFLLIALLIIICGGSYFAYLHFGGKTAEKPKSLQPTPTQQPISTVTPEATASGTLTPSVTGKVTPQPTGKATSKSAITVDVLNGSGQSGVAGQVSTFLKNAGYTVGTVGNADTFDYTNVTIKVKKSESSILDLLKKDLSTKYTVDTATTSLPENSTADAVVIIGQ